ncbi:unnamed protein product [Cyprideis torosa]|uniref:Lateral signaling target protein 2 homolog n=1 Tax=Cyprideis torosa TaxID=163714 RepID=A0A7R8W3M4_9CRUS|nr:unnamed protein product [Cyprideis torosa]CAG0883015.1 unnamed protein product [Cyprideis torosa]
MMNPGEMSLLFRKWFYRPKKEDESRMARFYWAEEELNMVTAELDSFDGRKDPERCSNLVAKLRHCQDKVLSVINEMMDEAIGGERAERDFRGKYPDDVLQDNLAGQLWFGAECLAAGSNILNREQESTVMRPFAKAVVKNLEKIRALLHDECYSPEPHYSEKLCETFKIFDRVLAEFEFLYVSAMVPVKTPREYDLQQDVTVLFSETTMRALSLGLIDQDMVDMYDPALMFTIPRLAIIAGLCIFPSGPLSLDVHPSSMCELFRPFRNLLRKIRRFLWTLSRDELCALEKALCSLNDPVLIPVDHGGEMYPGEQPSQDSEKLSTSTTTTFVKPDPPAPPPPEAVPGPPSRPSSSSSSSSPSSTSSLSSLADTSSSSPSPAHPQPPRPPRPLPQTPFNASTSSDSSTSSNSTPFHRSGDKGSKSRRRHSGRQPSSGDPQGPSSSTGRQRRRRRSSPTRPTSSPSLTKEQTMESIRETLQSVLQLAQEHRSTSDPCFASPPQGAATTGATSTRGDVTRCCCGRQTTTVPPEAVRVTAAEGARRERRKRIEEHAHGPAQSHRRRREQKGNCACAHGRQTSAGVEVAGRLSRRRELAYVWTKNFFLNFREVTLGCLDSPPSSGVVSPRGPSRPEAIPTLSPTDPKVWCPFSKYTPEDCRLIRSRFKDSQDLIHRLFVCVSGVADQLQTNFAGDLRNILRCVFVINSSPPAPEPKVEEAAIPERKKLDGGLAGAAPSSSSSISSAEEASLDSPPRPSASAPSASLLLPPSIPASAYAGNAILPGTSWGIPEVTAWGVSSERSITPEIAERPPPSTPPGPSRPPSSFPHSPSDAGIASTSQTLRQNLTVGLAEAPHESPEPDPGSPPIVGPMASLIDRGGPRTEIRQPPSWVPDEAAPLCMGCEAPFTVIRRRHHCRNCGKVFCGRCTPNSVPLPRYGLVKPVRVCNRCFLYYVTPFAPQEVL